MTVSEVQVFISSGEEDIRESRTEMEDLTKDKL